MSRIYEKPCRAGSFADALTPRERHASMTRLRIAVKKRWTKDAIIAALQEWARRNDGLAPRRSDWSSGGNAWPTTKHVDDAFSDRVVRGAFIPRDRCTGCRCERPIGVDFDGNHLYSQRPFSETGECPHAGPAGRHLPGVTAWAAALQDAGLAVRTKADGDAASAVTLRRNRQMVTGGTADVHPQVFER